MICYEFLLLKQKRRGFHDQPFVVTPRIDIHSFTGLPEDEGEERDARGWVTPGGMKWTRKGSHRSRSGEKAKEERCFPIRLIDSESRTEAHTLLSNPPFSSCTLPSFYEPYTFIGDNLFASYQLKVILSTTPERRPNSVSSDIPSLRNAYSSHLYALEFQNWILYLFILAYRQWVIN